MGNPTPEALAAASRRAADVQPVAVTLDRRRLWSRLRISPLNPQRTLAWWRMIDHWAAEARKLIEARGAFLTLGVADVRDDEILLSEGVRLSSLRHARLFRGARKAGLCAVTLGPALDERCNALAMAGSHDEACLLGTIGECALGEAQVRLQSAARESLGEALVNGVVLQPGAAYWGIEGNELFQRVLPLERLGVNLLESFALRPAKSKTFACAFVEVGRGRQEKRQ